MSDAAEWPNLAAMMFSLAARRGRRPMMRAYADGGWRAISWAEFAARAASVARGLRRAGVSAGDRVLVASEGRPELAVAETALMAIRAVPVPAYTTNTEADHAHLLRDSGARWAIVANAALAARVRAAAALGAGLDGLWCMQEGTETPFAPLQADGLGAADIAAEAHEIPPGALACLMYTSGTSGPPRGAMLPHRAILSNIAGVAPLARGLRLEGSVYLSYLPMSHSFEHTVGLFLLPRFGCELVFGRGVEHLAADMVTVRPTILTVVPRVLEVVRARILLQLRRGPAWRGRLFEWARAAGERRLEGRRRWHDRLADPLLDLLVRRTVRARFGGRLVAVVSGGARLDPALGRFFEAMGLPLLQGYGQTEAGPVISVNPPGRARNATVGPPLAGVELRIASDGEVLVRGGLVMDGYWGKREATAEALRDGWLHTGDVGALDAEGYLTITDRKKDIIVLSGGENVSPARIEAMLLEQPGVLQAVVSGEGEAGLFALLVAEEGAGAEVLERAVRAVNARLAPAERIRRHNGVAPFTIENGLLTPSQKVRRALILQRHAQGAAATR